MYLDVICSRAVDQIFDSHCNSDWNNRFGLARRHLNFHLIRMHLAFTQLHARGCSVSCVFAATLFLCLVRSEIPSLAGRSADGAIDGVTIAHTVG